MIYVPPLTEHWWFTNIIWYICHGFRYLQDWMNLLLQPQEVVTGHIPHHWPVSSSRIMLQASFTASCADHQATTRNHKHKSWSWALRVYYQISETSSVTACPVVRPPKGSLFVFNSSGYIAFRLHTRPFISAVPSTSQPKSLRTPVNIAHPM